MIQLLKQAFNFLKTGSKPEKNFIVVVNDRMLIVTEYALCSINLSYYLDQNEIDVLNGKYISFKLLEILKRSKFIFFENDSIVADYISIPFSGFKTGETATHHYLYAQEVIEKGLYEYETKEGKLYFPVGFSLYLLEQAKDYKRVSTDYLPFNASNLSLISNLLFDTKFKTSIVVEPVTIAIGKKKKSTFLLVSPNMCKLSDTGSFAIMAETLDNRN